MPLVTDFGYCGPSYAGPYTSAAGGMSAVFDSERCINLYPENVDPASGAHPKTQTALVGRPGLKLFATLPYSPVRALWAGFDIAKGAPYLFAVGGQYFYQISSSGAVTSVGAMSGSTGVGPAYIAYNGLEFLICDPTVSASGALPGALFEVGQNSSPTNVYGASDVEYMDGFFFALYNQGGTSQGDYNSVYVSGLLNGTSWNPLNFAQRTGGADLLMRLCVLNGLLYMIGERTIEVWYNAGNATFPLSRVTGADINVGIVQLNSLVKFRNTFMWIGGDQQGQPAVYMMNGMTPVRVSNFGIEYLLASSSDMAQRRGMTCYGYTEGGHTFYCINSPYMTNYNGQAGNTLVYDLTTNMWHERVNTMSSGVVQQALPQCTAVLTDFASLSGGNSFVFAGDYSSGNIYFQSIANTNDNGLAITRIRRAPHRSSGNRWFRYPSFEIDADIGTAQMSLQYSNDGGRTFPHSRPAMAASNDQGYGSAGGGFGRFKWWQLGRSRDRVFQTTITDANNPIRLQGAYLFADPGMAAQLEQA